jgi:hypothetical protein
VSPPRTNASGPTLSARIQKTVMRLMFRLPETVKRRIAGPPVEIVIAVLREAVQQASDLVHQCRTAASDYGHSPARHRHHPLPHPHHRRLPPQLAARSRGVTECPDNPLLAAFGENAVAGWLRSQPGGAERCPRSLCTPVSTRSWNRCRLRRSGRLRLGTRLGVGACEWHRGRVPAGLRSPRTARGMA